MRSVSSRRAQASLLLGVVTFVFFTLTWHFAAHLTLASAVAMAAFMGLVVTLAISRLSR